MHKFIDKTKELWKLTPSTDRIFICVGIAALLLAFGVSVTHPTSKEAPDSSTKIKPLVITTEDTKEEEVEVPVEEPEETATQDAPNTISLDGWEGALLYDEAYQITENHLRPTTGETYFNNHKETYYTSPGGDLLNIPGEHVASDGTIRDQDGYICIAMPSDSGWLDFGDTILTSMGPGKVYDEGTMSGYWIDLYTTW